MKRGKVQFFIVFGLIVVLAAMNIIGISTQWGDTTTEYVRGLRDINWGLDINGGTEAVFTPSSEDEEISKSQMKEVDRIIKERMSVYNITDYEVNTDYENNSIVVRFPWLAGESASDVQSVIDALGSTNELLVINGEVDTSTGTATGDTILTSEDIKSAAAKSGYFQSSSSATSSTLQYYVSLSLTSEGTEKLKEATEQMIEDGGGTIAITMDGSLLSYSDLTEEDEPLTEGVLTVTSSSEETAKELAELINVGQMPFALSSPTYAKVSSPLAFQPKMMILIASIAAIVVTAIMLIFKYKLAGAVACATLVGQASLTLTILTGFFSPFPNFILTLPGIAGIFAGLVMGLAYNVISIRFVKEELDNGKSLLGSVTAGQKRGFAIVKHSNFLILLIAIILIGAFGNGLFSSIFSPLYFLFDNLSDGSIYSFCYTLGVTILCNFVAIGASRVMLRALTTFECFQKPELFGGAK